MQSSMSQHTTQTKRRKSQRLQNRHRVQTCTLAVCFLVCDVFPVWSTWRLWYEQADTTIQQRIQFIIQPTGNIQIPSSITQHNAVIVLPHRSTTWGHSSIVRAEMMLFDKAVQLGCGVSVLVSEKTIPLRSASLYVDRAMFLLTRSYDAMFYVYPFPLGNIANHELFLRYYNKCGSQFMMLNNFSYRATRNSILDFLHITERDDVDWPDICKRQMFLAPDEFVIQSIMKRVYKGQVVATHNFTSSRAPLNVPLPKTCALIQNWKKNGNMPFAFRKVMNQENAEYLFTHYCVGKA